MEKEKTDIIINSLKKNRERGLRRKSLIDFNILGWIKLKGELHKFLQGDIFDTYVYHSNLVSEHGCPNIYNTDKWFLQKIIVSSC